MWLLSLLAFSQQSYLVNITTIGAKVKNMLFF